MEIFAIILGGILAFALGVPWYMLLAKPWQQASGVTDNQVQSGGSLPYVLAIVFWLISSFFLQTYLMPADGSLLAMIRPAFAAWISMAMLSTVLSTMYGMRGRNLLWIDAGYTLAGALVIAVVHFLLY